MEECKMTNDYEVKMFKQIFVGAACEVLKDKCFDSGYVDVSKVKDLIFGGNTIFIKTSVISDEETTFTHTADELYEVDGYHNLQQKMMEDIQKRLKSNIKNINHVDSKEKAPDEVSKNEDDWILHLIAGDINIKLLYEIGAAELSKTSIGVGINPHAVDDMIHIDLVNIKAEDHFSIRCTTIRDLIEMGCYRAAFGIISRKLETFIEEVNKNGENDEKTNEITENK